MKDLLKDKGFTDEQMKVITEAHGEKLKNTYIPLDRFNEVNEKLKAEALKVKERDGQISELGKTDIEGLKEQIKTLQDDNKKKDKESLEALDKVRKVNATKLAWLSDAEFKALDLDYVLEKTDLSLIKLDEAGAIASGFKEQRDTMVKDRVGLFEAKQADDKGKLNGGKLLGKTPPDGDKKLEQSGEFSLGAQLGKRQAQKMPVKTIESLNVWAAQ